MKLSELLKKCKTNFFLNNFFDFNVVDLSADSRLVKNNYIFAAIPGNKENGEKYIKDIIKFKKIAIIISKNSKKKINNSNFVFIQTPEVRKLFSEIAHILNKNSIKETVAVTGTNGKTSISDYTRQLWKHLNFKSASIGTLGLIYKNKKIDESKLTTLIL